MEHITGGICAPKGYTASSVHCGIRKNRDKNDLSLIYSACPASAAAVYTLNAVKGAPIAVTKEHLKNGIAQAMICNSGNANTCNENGMEIANGTCKLLARELGVKEEDVIIASTGVIGQAMELAPFEKGIPPLVKGLGLNSEEAAHGIMTTDTKLKQIAVSFDIGGVECKMGAIAKGSGMINPNMATMLGFITTDAAISPALLQKALSEDVKYSFNMVIVDGDTSTNDMVSIMANGMAGNAPIESEGEDYEAFKAALREVTLYLCRSIAADGEGATKLLICSVKGGRSEESARAAARSVISSSLVKAAMFGEDANWGRVLCALGYSAAGVDPDKIDVSFVSDLGKVTVCKMGRYFEFSEEQAAKILSAKEILIDVDLHDGDSIATAWGCDLTYDYVKINGDYRT